MAHPLTWLRKLLGRSVFRRLPSGSAMETVLSMMFHRLSATIYLFYSIWAIVSVVKGLPTLSSPNGEQWQVIFSIAVLLFAAPSCFGATFWPLFARLELFFGAMLAGLLFIYFGYVLWSAVSNGGSWSGVVLIASILVVPVCRFAIILMFMLRQADERRAVAAQEV